MADLSAARTDTSDNNNQMTVPADFIREIASEFPRAVVSARRRVIVQSLHKMHPAFSRENGHEKPEQCLRQAVRDKLAEHSLCFRTCLCGLTSPARPAGR